MTFRTSSRLISRLPRSCFGALVSCALMAGVGVSTGVIASVALTSHALAAETLSSETIRLFAAIRAGDLAAVQKAVVEGADLDAVDHDNKTPAELADSLDHFTITHFLRAYQVIEGGGDAPSTATASGTQPSDADPQSLFVTQGQLFDEAGGMVQEPTQARDDLTLVPSKPISTFESRITTAVEAVSSGEVAAQAPEEAEDFFAEMQVFGGEPDDMNKVGPAGEQIQSGNAVSQLGTTDLVAPPSSPLGKVLPEHERLRNLVLEKLRRESEDRLAILETAREEMVNQVIEEERAALQGSGEKNVEAGFRAKKRAELTGVTIPPGYVPPPDGGSSALRFLQRLGLFDNEETAKPQRSETEAIADQLSAAFSTGTSSAFINSGYSVPPSGQVIETSGDNAVAVIGQMTRLFSPVPTGQASGSQRLIDSLSAGTGTAQFAQSPAENIILPQGIMQGIVQAGPPAESWDVTASVGGLSGSMQGTPEDPVAQPPEAESPILDELADIFGRDSQQQTADMPPSPLAAGGSWDVVDVRIGPSANRMMMGVPVGQQIVRSTATPATPLVLGQSVILGKSPPTALDPRAEGKSCITKRQNSVTFCIESVDWPDELKGVIWVDTVMYQGLNAIARYDNGVATRFHALFPSESFKSIIEYYVAKLGPPHNAWNRSITPLASPQQANPTVSWKAVNPYTQVVAVLEIRQFDDTRGGFPDEKRGAIMLHNAQSGTIFPQVSAFELMRLRPL